ncbi:sulfate transporter CysZ [Halomonas sp. HMF6819]|uniref:sulfate transporter CysZ n=1 Tax=Halomonas sp. HMF6819 TaxID=3373085 RepID=UPI0037945974
MLTAVSALSQGLRLVYQKGQRRYVFLPILINLIVYIGLASFTARRFSGWLDHAMASIPTWLDWLDWLLWPLFVLSLLVAIFFTFTLVTHFIAAPFYGFLAARVERTATGVEPLDDRGLGKTALDAVGRELVKLRYILPRVALLFVFSWIPGLNLAAPFLWALFSAWVMAITYLDYPMDNNKVSFKEMRRRLSARWWPSMSYGGLVTLITWIPLANLFLLPGAVAGAVLMWDAHYRDLERLPAR